MRKIFLAMLSFASLLCSTDAAQAGWELREICKQEVVASVFNPVTQTWDSGIQTVCKKRKVYVPDSAVQRTAPRNCIGITYTPNSQYKGIGTVDEVFRGSPAAQAELQAGDVILSVDGQSVQNIQQIVASRKLGDTVNLSVIKKGSLQVLNLRIPVAQCSQ